jgi:hypothetical protein
MGVHGPPCPARKSRGAEDALARRAEHKPFASAAAQALLEQVERRTLAIGALRCPARLFGSITIRSLSSNERSTRISLASNSTASQRSACEFPGSNGWSQVTGLA